MFFKLVTSFAYFLTRFSTERTLILFFCMERNSALALPSIGMISFRSFRYSQRACSTSSPKYTMDSYPPFRWTFIPLFLKSISVRSRPTHSETRMPVPSINVSRARSRFFVWEWYAFCRFVRFSPDSTSSKSRATSSTSKRTIVFSWSFGIWTSSAGLVAMRSVRKKKL